MPRFRRTWLAAVAVRPRFLPIVGAAVIGAALLLSHSVPTSHAQGGVPAPPPAARCAHIAVTNNPQTVKQLRMPRLQYNLDNCGTESIAVTVTIVEWDSAWSVTCPSPVDAPAQFSLAPKQKVSTPATVYRGACGFQGHNLQLLVTDDLTGNLLSIGYFSWQDDPPRL